MDRKLDHQLTFKDICVSFAFKLIVVDYFIFTMEGLASRENFKKYIAYRLLAMNSSF